MSSCCVELVVPLHTHVQRCSVDIFHIFGPYGTLGVSRKQETTKAGARGKRAIAPFIISSETDTMFQLL